MLRFFKRSSKALRDLKDFLGICEYQGKVHCHFAHHAYFCACNASRNYEKGYVSENQKISTKETNMPPFEARLTLIESLQLWLWAGIGLVLNGAVQT